MTGKLWLWFQSSNLPVKLGKSWSGNSEGSELTGKFCYWIQCHNLPVKVGKRVVFENFMNFWLPVNTGKFMYKLQFVTIYQSTLAENAIVKFRNSWFTGKFWFWIQSLNLPVKFENSNFWLFFCQNWLVNYVFEIRGTIYQ